MFIEIHVINIHIDAHIINSISDRTNNYCIHKINRTTSTHTNKKKYTHLGNSGLNDEYANLEQNYLNGTIRDYLYQFWHIV